MAESCEVRQSLLCTICLDVLKVPVTLHCGHSYCMDCISGFWDQEDRKGVYSCPQCRHMFTERPVLNRNMVLLDLTTNVASKEQATPSAKKKVDVECDFCTVGKLKAVKSCLVCLASYCATHIQPHYESAAFKRHTLVDVWVSIQDKICSKHDKLLEVYCRTDDQCICLLCVMDEHKGHNTVSAAAERKRKEQQFGKIKQKYVQGVQEKQKQLSHLRQNITTLQSSKKAALDQNEKAYAEVVSMADKRRSAVKEHINTQEKAATGRVETLAHRLEKEIKDLKKKEDELKLLLQTEDHIHFLQHCGPILDCKYTQVQSGVNIHSMAFGFITEVISDFREKAELLMKSMEDISTQIDLEPKTWKEFATYWCHLSLDPNTAFENLLLSEGNKRVTWTKRAQKYPPHSDRFTKYDQVLCSEGLCGVCYWEFEWKGPRVEVALNYKGEKLQENGFGYTDESWCLTLSPSSCAFWHSGVRVKVSDSCSSTVGVFLDQKAGSLCFYSVLDRAQMVLLHRAQAMFSHPLYPGFMVSRGSSVQIVPPE